MAEPTPPPATPDGGESDSVEWSPGDRPRDAAADAATDTGERLLDPEEIDGLLQGG